MTFDELCKDFDARKPTGRRIGTTFWFQAIWENPNDSVNDLLRKKLKDFGLEYLNTANGDVWFLFDNRWCTCDRMIDGPIVTFYMVDYEEK